MLAIFLIQVISMRIDKMALVCGVGINDGKYKASLNGKHIREYDHWKNMIDRCYSPKSLSKNKTYIGCSASENFKSFSYFYEWCHNQVGFNLKDWELDKDVLLKGNKLYSEDRCLFLPKEINQILVKSNATRGLHPIGVSYDKRRGLFESCLRKNGKKKFIGYFDNEMEAYIEYKKHKEEYIKTVAEKWRGVIDDRAFESLIRYNVDVGD